MARNYYYLVAGLKEYSIDTDTKGFDAAEIRYEIMDGLHASDQRHLRDLYMFYDITNIIAALSGKNSFNSLGNFSAEELEQEMERPVLLPRYAADVILAYRNKVKEDKFNEIDETIDTDLPEEKNLWMRFYAACDRSENRFIRKWYGFDRELRNICAAYTARERGREIAPELIGTGDLIVSLARSSAVDFGLKNEIDYMDRLIQILDTKNMVEKERRLDLLRWEKADEFTEFDYFTVDKILAYCVKLNIIHRWMSLDKSIGAEMFRKLIAELSSKEILDKAEKEAENADTK